MADELDPKELSRYADALYNANRLEASRQNLERRREAAQLESISSTEALKQDVRQLLFEIRQERDERHKQALWQDRIYEDLANRMERLERGLILVLTENNPQRRIDASQELGQELDIRQELKKRYRNLHKLQTQAADYGSMDIPLKLQNAIEAEDCKIKELEAKLHDA